MENSLKSGACPKCDYKEVYYTENDSHKILPHHFGGAFTLDTRPAPTVDNYVCGNCGFAEFYVRPSRLDTIKKNWNLKKSP